MSLRAKLALVLAAVMVGPLVAAWVAIGVLVPHAASSAAAAALDRAGAATVAYLGQQCLGLGDAVRAAAQADPAHPDRAVADLVARRPGVSAFVLRSGSVVASAGPLAGRLSTADVVAAGNASCARREAAASTAVVGLTEAVPVRTADGTESARVVVVQPLDAAALGAVHDTLGLGADLALLRTEGSARVAASTVPDGDLGPVVGELASRGSAAGGAAAGEAGTWRYRVLAAPSGVPYTVLVVSHLDSSRLQLVLLLAVLAFSAVFAGLLVVLTGRLTGPLAALTLTAHRLGRGDLAARSGIRGPDEVGTLGHALDSMAQALQSTVTELQARRDALAETFEQFGEALGHTHDLDGLLRTVVEAAKQGGSASVGTAFLLDPSAQEGGAGALEERVASAPDGASGEWVARVIDALSVLSMQAVERVEPVVADLTPLAGTALVAPLLRGDEVVGTLAVARRTGEPAPDAAAVAAVTALAEHAGTAIANVQEHQTAQRLSLTDPLTGAANFRQLSATLNREVERAARFDRPVSVLMLDLDHFKQVNDTHGHAFGDAVLREFARRLQTCVREVDLVARYGGEEFAVVLPETGPDGAITVAARIVEAVRGEIFAAGGQSRNVTVSVGVAAYPVHGQSVGEVLRAADAALYVAKHGGRDRWIVADSSDSVVLETAGTGPSGPSVPPGSSGSRVGTEAARDGGRDAGQANGTGTLRHS